MKAMKAMKQVRIAMAKPKVARNAAMKVIQAMAKPEVMKITKTKRTQAMVANTNTLQNQGMGVFAPKQLLKNCSSAPKLKAKAAPLLKGQLNINAVPKASSSTTALTPSQQPQPEHFLAAAGRAGFQITPTS